MTVSGSYDFGLTRNQIITEALENLGVIAAGETPSAADMESAGKSLNLLLKGLQADRIALWAVDQQYVSLSDGVSSYALATGTTKVLSAWMKINGQDVMLDVIDRDTYEATVTKAAEDMPYQVWVDYAVNPPRLYPIPVPGSSYTLYYRRERMLSDFDAVSDTTDLPVKALEMLVFGLSHRLCGKFGLGMGDRQYWEGQFEKAKINYRAGDNLRWHRAIVIPDKVV